MTKIGRNSRDGRRSKKEEKEMKKLLTWPRESPEDNPKPPTVPFLPIIEGMFLAGIIIPAGIFHTLENFDPSPSVLSRVQCCVF